MYYLLEDTQLTVLLCTISWIKIITGNKTLKPRFCRQEGWGVHKAEGDWTGEEGVDVRMDKPIHPSIL